MKYLDVDGIGRVSRIGVGTWQFGSREWGYGDSYASGAARDIVQRALALGVTLFDTAEIYAMGKSERILGEALGDQRSTVALASKIFPVAPFPLVIKQRERASARRLQVARIPLYQIHQPNRAGTAGRQVRSRQSPRRRACDEPAVRHREPAAGGAAAADAA